MGCNNLGLPTPTVGTDTCRIYLKGSSDFSGGIEGIETYYLGTWPDTRGGPGEGQLRVGLGYEGPVTFVATVRGCGTGTFQMQVSEGFLDSTSYKPTAAGGETQGHNLWRVLPATATGGLAGRLLGGSGETNWTNHPFSLGNDFGVGTFTGTLTCAS